MSRNLRIVVTVLLLHVGVLWALQTGLLRRVVEIIVPAQVLVEMVTPKEDKPEPQPPPPKPVKTKLTPVTPPTPLAVTTPAPQPSEITLAPVDPSPPVNAVEKTSSNATATATTSTVAAPPAPPKLELPSSDADYLNNPKPPYPPLSKRMGEQGKVVIRTLIGADGVATEASIQKSSGFDRLDQAALATARKWRYVPGKRAGVAEAMWFNVPFTFVLE